MTGHGAVRSGRAGGAGALLGLGLFAARRGYSIIDVLTSVTVLGIAVLALVSVVGAGSRGRLTSRQRAIALRLVEQRLDLLDARGAELLPACEGLEGCRDEEGGLRPALAPAGAYPCTQLMNEPSLSDPLREEADGKLRLDTIVFPHPDPDQRTVSRLVTVSACWYDARGEVREYRAHRLILDEQEGS